jgi:hypothetical protein
VIGEAAWGPGVRLGKGVSGRAQRDRGARDPTRGAPRTWRAPASRIQSRVGGWVSPLGDSFSEGAARKGGPKGETKPGRRDASRVIAPIPPDFGHSNWFTLRGSGQRL